MPAGKASKVFHAKPSAISLGGIVGRSSVFRPRFQSFIRDAIAT
jgi:hypothetical protein